MAQLGALFQQLAILLHAESTHTQRLHITSAVRAGGVASACDPLHFHPLTYVGVVVSGVEDVEPALRKGQPLPSLRHSTVHGLSTRQVLYDSLNDRVWKLFDVCGETGDVDALQLGARSMPEAGWVFRV